MESLLHRQSPCHDLDGPRFSAFRSPTGKRWLGTLFGYALLECLILLLLGGFLTTELGAVCQTESSSAESIFEKSGVDSREQKTVAGPVYSAPVVSKWKAGVKITGSASDSYNVFISLPVPAEWPEQAVTVAEEQIPGNIGEVSFRDLESGVRQLLIRIPLLPAGQEITISKTFRVLTSQVDPPPQTEDFLRPKKTHKEGKGYLATSQQINFNDGKLRRQVTEIVADKAHVWEEIEAIFDWVRDNIDQKEMPNYDSLRAFRERGGSEDDKVALFIAMCRVNKVPARFVWVDGSSYAEFMLVDEEDKGYWFPCNVTGIREFGSYSEPKVILQKGDNIKVPEKEARQRFVSEFVSVQGTSKPRVSFIRELLPADD